MRLWSAKRNLFIYISRSNSRACIHILDIPNCGSAPGRPHAILILVVLEPFNDFRLLQRTSYRRQLIYTIRPQRAMRTVARGASYHVAVDARPWPGRVSLAYLPHRGYRDLSASQMLIVYVTQYLKDK